MVSLVQPLIGRPLSRVTALQVAQMKLLREAGNTEIAIARAVGCSRDAVHYHLTKGKVLPFVVIPPWAETLSTAINAAYQGRPEMAAQLMREAATQLEKQP